MADIEVSIIIPVYNGSAHIELAIESALEAAQACQRTELIIVDNNSTDDGISKAVRCLENKRLPFLLLQERRAGASAARNSGLARARGEWIQFLDADDVLATEKIRSQLQLAHKLDQRAACIYSQWARVSDDLSEVLSVERPIVRTTGLGCAVDLIAEGNFIATGSQLFRRSALEEVGGFSNAVMIEDVELQLRLALGQWQFAHCELQDPGLFYRQHQSSLSRSDARVFALAVRRNAKLLYEAARAQGRIPAEVLASVSASYYQSCRSLAEHSWSDMEETFRESEAIGLDVVQHGPPLFRFCARTIGYHNAERIAKARRARRGES